ncbi:DUF3224 domain-containing protein [Streptosporangium subroseum]|uniref:DUF3224 domain-containing protein n=1 Tax=Streptosporangium subroseum TaxID=106412 RepID=UPI003442EF29
MIKTFRYITHSGPSAARKSTISLSRLLPFEPASRSPWRQEGDEHDLSPEPNCYHRRCLYKNPDGYRDDGGTSVKPGGPSEWAGCLMLWPRHAELSDPLNIIGAMRASGTFTVKSFAPTELAPSPPVSTGVAVGVATMEKHFEGDIVGHSATLFTSAFDQTSGVGTYVAMESFEGSLHDRDGAFNFAHSATTSGSDRTNEFFTIVPSSGTGQMTGITGSGGLTVEADGTHRMWVDYELS